MRNIYFSITSKSQNKSSNECSGESDLMPATAGRTKIRNSIYVFLKGQLHTLFMKKKFFIKPCDISILYQLIVQKPLSPRKKYHGLVFVIFVLVREAFVNASPLTNSGEVYNNVSVSFLIPGTQISPFYFIIRRVLALREFGLYDYFQSSAIPNFTACLAPPTKISVSTSLSITNLWVRICEKKRHHSVFVL